MERKTKKDQRKHEWEQQLSTILKILLVDRSQARRPALGAGPGPSYVTERSGPDGIWLLPRIARWDLGTENMTACRGSNSKHPHFKIKHGH